MKQDTLMMIAFMAVLLFLAVSLLINTSKSCDVNIDYKVSVDTNSTSYPNVAEVKLACYKLCLDQLRGSDYLNDCLDKCEVLE